MENWAVDSITAVGLGVLTLYTSTTAKPSCSISVPSTVFFPSNYCFSYLGLVTRRPKVMEVYTQCLYSSEDHRSKFKLAAVLTLW